MASLHRVPTPFSTVDLMFSVVDVVWEAFHFQVGASLSKRRPCTHVNFLRRFCKSKGYQLMAVLFTRAIPLNSGKSQKKYNIKKFLAKACNCTIIILESQQILLYGVRYGGARRQISNLCENTGKEGKVCGVSCTWNPWIQRLNRCVKGRSVADINDGPGVSPRA